MRTHRSTNATRPAVLAAVAVGLLLVAACGSDDAGDEVERVSVEQFAERLCDVTRQFEESSSDVDLSLANAEPGTEEFRDGMTSILSTMRELVDEYSELNNSVRLDGNDGVAYQEFFADKMSTGGERIDQYLEAFAATEMPTADVDEVLGDIHLSIVDDSTEVGRELATAVRNCELG